MLIIFEMPIWFERFEMNGLSSLVLLWRPRPTTTGPRSTSRPPPPSPPPPPPPPGTTGASRAPSRQLTGGNAGQISLTLPRKRNKFEWPKLESRKKIRKTKKKLIQMHKMIGCPWQNRKLPKIIL